MEKFQICYSLNKYQMKKIKIFIELTRLNKPIGFLLLFWPCLWGLTLGYYFNSGEQFYILNI